MRRLIYLPLEAYEERYTSQLCKWNTDRFEARGIEYILVPGADLRDDDAINVGQVLDAHGRSYYSLHQMANLVAILHDEDLNIDNNDVIFSEDLFQPGYSALPYILAQLPPEKRPQVFTRCLAQSIDPDDFVHPMRSWMRHFEMIVDKTVDGILMANTEMGPHMRIAMHEAPLYVTGLPFDKQEARSRVVQEIKPLNNRCRRVVFSSRWDKEKQPWFYMDLIELFNERQPGHDIEFAVTTGAKGLRSTNQEYLDRANKMVEEGKMKIYQGLPKSTYYSLLANSRVQFNCARQDWQSNTLNEASAFGTFSLAPAFRSFPEALDNNERFLFVPWSLEDAYQKMNALLELSDTELEYDIDGFVVGLNVEYPSNEMHDTIDKTIDIMFDNGNARKDNAFDKNYPHHRFRCDNRYGE